MALVWDALNEGQVTMGYNKFKPHISLVMVLPIAAALVLPSMLYAAEKRPLIPGYLPERGEIFSSIGLGYSEGSSSASGTGVFAGPSYRARFSSTGIGIGLVYGVSDNIKASLGLTHIASVKLKGDGADSADAPTGWTSPNLGILRVFELGSRSRIELELGYTPKIDSSPLRNYSAGGLSVNYSHLLDNGFWATSRLAYGTYEGDRPDSYVLSLGFAGPVQTVTLAAGLTLAKVNSQTSADGFIRQTPRVSPAFAVSFSGPISKGTFWTIALNHSRAKSITRHLTEDGTSTSRGETNGLTVSLLREFP